MRVYFFLIKMALEPPTTVSHKMTKCALEPPTTEIQLLPQILPVY